MFSLSSDPSLHVSLPVADGRWSGIPQEIALSIEEKYDEIRALITLGKEKGYLLYEEVNELLPADITSSEELDDLFSTFGNAGIEVVDSEQKYREDKLLGERPDGGGTGDEP